MKKNSTYYAQGWESQGGGYHITIPATDKIMTVEEVDILSKKMLIFHREYHYLSKKNQIAELFTNEFLVYKNKSINTFYFNFLEKYIKEERVISFFPFLSKDLDRKEGCMPFSSNVYYHSSDKNIINKYIYFMNETYGNFKLYDFTQYKKIDYLGYENIISVNSYGNLKEGELFNKPISFYIEINSNLFFSHVARHEFKEPIDNREIAYLNTPRVNSFLRDLKTLAENNGWKFSFEETVSSDFPIQPEGIFLDGKIIYQEDIDNGLIKIPNT